jgi:hypothetical protein
MSENSKSYGVVRDLFVVRLELQRGKERVSWEKKDGCVGR